MRSVRQTRTFHHAPSSQCCKVEGSDAFCAEWTPKLEAVLTTLRSTAEAYTLARKTYSEVFQDEVALRAEHYQAIDKLMGLVRAAFPNDRAKQDLVFPVIDDGDGSVSEEGESSEG
jgi:hypothetical protein